MSDSPVEPAPIDAEPQIRATFPDLAGQVAVITGASRGIGVGIAEFLSRQGMKVVLTARSDDAGRAVTDTLVARGRAAAWVAADVSTAEGAQAVFDFAAATFGRVDLLVNNAAILWSRSILETDDDVYAKTFEANARMVFGLSRLCALHMVQRGEGGNIINISSVGGLRPHRGHFGYDASKGAMDSMTRSMAVDLAEHGIRVNTIAPGTTKARPEHPKMLAAYHRIREHVPIQRNATCEEIGAAVAFFASSAAGYITGQTLYVDGGLTTQLSPPGIWV